ncbi:inverse autotransporter beta domain-containing protein [Lelliottia wanjuensis]|uniref:Inverse autotransporter beta domain-containing protein n=1 Tax=Lelliottia wanjuensis TaxID=3050585 RepID=A0AAP4D2I4_9ENTR|nr:MULTISPECIES: inverse autotransporter beta domain-containing protein [unclassified Lelliottia]MDK9362342.1 inverse autotransporter beta domain-containing protein [Lelliottia sp. V106_12]MDK9616847.1 inverse autotransporter beta domain-containing protein [Lelliottia sp. V106_9]
MLPVYILLALFCFMLSFGISFAAENINLPDLGSDSAMQKNNTDKSDGDTGNNEKNIEKKVSDIAVNEAQQRFQNLTPEGMKSEFYQYGKGVVTGAAQSQIDNLLSPYGHVATNIAIDDKGNLDGSSLDYLVPWYNGESDLLFSQFSVHNKDGRTIANIGTGVRHNVSKDWMLGTNAFYDHDITRGHKRLGIGTEAWTNYLKLSGNYYLPLSSWKDSPDLDDYQERPARGWDARVQTYLPAYPQLGGSIVYEKYYGDQVALFGTDDLQEDPSAVTLGVDYTPVPLITLKAGYKTDQSEKSEVKVNLDIDYRINVSLSKQLDGDEVAQMRTLAGSRMDFVDRNNDIVLEYREKNDLDVGIFLAPTNTAAPCILTDAPDTAQAYEGCHWTVNADITSHLKIQSAHWVPMGNFSPEKALALPALSPSTNIATGKDNHWTLTFPAWVDSPDSNANKYRLAVTLVDEKGHTRQSNAVNILVAEAPTNYQLVIDDEDGEKKAVKAPANGITPVNLKSYGAKAAGVHGETTPVAPENLDMTFHAYEVKDRDHAHEVPIHKSKKECDNEQKCLFFVSGSSNGKAVVSSTRSGIYAFVATQQDEDGQKTNPVLVDFSDSSQYIVAAIVDTQNPTTNLIGIKSNKLALGHQYRFILAWDSNKNGQWDASDLQTVSSTDLRPLTEVTHYRWLFDGKSTNGMPGGYAASNTDNQDISIPVTNAEAKAIFPAAGINGVQGYQLRVDYKLTTEGMQFVQANFK